MTLNRSLRLSPRLFGFLQEDRANACSFERLPSLRQTAFGDDGVHDLDIARWGLGVTTHPVRVTAHGSRIQVKGEREFPDNMMVAYRHEEGKVLLYEERDWTPYAFTWARRRNWDPASRIVSEVLY